MDKKIKDEQPVVCADCRKIEVQKSGAICAKCQKKRIVEAWSKPIRL